MPKLFGLGGYLSAYRRKITWPQSPLEARQYALLRRAAELVDLGRLKHTLTRRIDGINAAGLIEAHALVEAGNMIGKVVVANR